MITIFLIVKNLNSKRLIPYPFPRSMAVKKVKSFPYEHYQNGIPTDEIIAKIK